MVAAGKLMPLTVLELLALVPVARVRSSPETAVAPTAAEALVTVKDCSLEASAVKEVSVKLTIVPEVAVEVTVSAARVPTVVMLVKLPAARSALTMVEEVKAPPAELCTIPRPKVLSVSAVKVAAPGVVPPMVPGAAKVAPERVEAFKLATLVVEVTTRGAVPVATVEVS